MTCVFDALEVFGARCSELGWEIMILLEIVRDSDQGLDWSRSSENRRE